MRHDATNNIVLHIDHVHKTFAGLHALADVNLDIGEGETHAIIGPNGAGKSTLLNVCVGVLPPTQGKVMFHGTELTGLQAVRDQPARRGAGVPDAGDLRRSDRAART